MIFFFLHAAALVIILVYLSIRVVHGRAVLCPAATLAARDCDLVLQRGSRAREVCVN